MTLGLRLRLLFGWLGDRYGRYCDWRAWHSTRTMRRAFLAKLAVDATRPEVIGRHAYAGPDGVDYERMWWAVDGALPPEREGEIRTPAGVWPALLNVEAAARELAAQFTYDDCVPRLTLGMPTECALLSLHDYLNDVTNAREADQDA